MTKSGVHHVKSGTDYTYEIPVHNFCELSE